VRFDPFQELDRLAAPSPGRPALLAMDADRRGDQFVVHFEQLSRQLFLGEGLDADTIAATYQDGVPTTTIPVAEKAKPRKVAIQTHNGSQPKAVDAVSAEH